MHFQAVSATVALLFSVLVVSTPVELVKRVNGGPSPDDPTFQAAVLNNHNYWRAIHHSPNLVWDKNLAYYAQYAANAYCKVTHTVSRQS